MVNFLRAALAPGPLEESNPRFTTPHSGASAPEPYRALTRQLSELGDELTAFQMELKGLQ